MAQKPVVPELIQEQATPERLAEITLILLNDSLRREKMKAEFKTVRAALGESGAVEKAAKVILETI